MSTPTDLHVCIIGAGKRFHFTFLYHLPPLPLPLLFSPRLLFNYVTGMGGLATALCLAKRGFNNIHVYESASNLGFVGAGIQLAPNLVRILDGLGVWEGIEKEACDVKETWIRRK